MPNILTYNKVNFSVFASKRNGYDGCIFDNSVDKDFAIYFTLEKNNGAYECVFDFNIGNYVITDYVPIQDIPTGLNTRIKFRDAVINRDFETKFKVIHKSFIVSEMYNTERFKQIEEGYKDRLLDLNNQINTLKDDLNKVKASFEDERKKELSSTVFKIDIDDTKRRQILASYKNKIPVLLYGPSGTGKSSLVREIAEMYNLELTGLSFNGDTNVEHLLGHFVLDEGKMIFRDGPLTDAVRNGKIFLADELNASSPEIQFILNSLLENRNGEYGDLLVQSNHGEKIQPHPNFRFFGTYNPNYIGTKKFSNSLLSRFVSVEIPPLLGTKEVEVLTNKELSIVKDDLVKLCNIKTYSYKNKSADYDMSTRDIEQIARLYSTGLNIKEAFEVVVLNNCQYEEDKIYFNNLFENEFGKD